jgi:hypothetical protein
VKKQDHDVELNPIVRTPMDQQKVYWGLHYVKNKDGKYVGERMGLSCKKTMLNLIDRWKKELDSDGFYMGEIRGNKYPEIPSYEEAKSCQP